MFIVVCYGVCADRGIIPWWVAAAILSRELGVTVLRSSLELRGRRLPSTNAAKAKTWVQMLGIGFVALSPIVAARGNLALLFGVPLGGRADRDAIVRFSPRRRFRPIEFAATVLIGFLTAALLGGAPAARITVLAFVVAMTWYSAADYLAVGFRELVRPDPYRRLHWVRLAAGAALPILAMVAIGTTGAPRHAAHHPAVGRHGARRARQLRRQPPRHRLLLGGQPGAEIALLAGALVVRGRGPCDIFAAAIGVIETLRSLARYLRAPAPSARPVAPTPIPRPPDIDPVVRA